MAVFFKLNIPSLLCLHYTISVVYIQCTSVKYTVMVLSYSTLKMTMTDTFRHANIVSKALTHQEHLGRSSVLTILKLQITCPDVVVGFCQVNRDIFGRNHIKVTTLALWHTWHLHFDLYETHFNASTSWATFWCSKIHFFNVCRVVLLWSQWSKVPALQSWRVWQCRKKRRI